MRIARHLGDGTEAFESKVGRALRRLREEGGIGPGNPGIELEEVDVSKLLLTVLQKKKNQISTLEGLANQMDRSPKTVQRALEELVGLGYNVYCNEGNVSLTEEDAQREATQQDNRAGGTVRFGVVSDTPLGAKAERLDVLEDLYQWFSDEGITTVYHAGNWIEGEFRNNLRERHVHGLDNQIDYFLERYPKVDGLTTEYIAGDDHEGWYQQREGISIGRYLESRAQEQGRMDLKYLGYLEHDIEFANSAGRMIVRIAHPGGGSAYALSYTPQKIVESYSRGEKPDVLIIGHYHKLEYIPAVRGVRVIQAGCTVDQGTWARKKRLAYHLGGWIIELDQCPQTGACRGCTTKDRTYFDREYHRNWEP